MKIICDFDGTVAANDVGSLLFRTFGDESCKEFVELWKQGEISSKQCLIEECRVTRVTKQELTRFADSQELDPYFKEFVQFCHGRGFDIEIVSDGLDFYINRILKNHGLDSSIEVRSNELTFKNEHRVKPQFPYFEHSCGQCANCKGHHVRQAKKCHSKVIYVGDGLSDRCGAQEADTVFAKRGRDLLEFCKQENIPHFEFENFGDVLNQLRHLKLY
ncbi:MtnX-like HAD-IB family phosphatase [candidate division KSB1 bacterium]|nr:MtnX-like HAD-IB family phosphatase [candidate division KSB1 bacterium]NIR69951.1 MtnX-like HAD-IB family phosphatase [candidate division KSB1 bacterium]NIS25850.1 MtnX-like HAD-IB family phosphatase [candidate division KSB1 bacterium]NIT72727.1 MtnX-like HAD-IB family phosphatase [candidate division KSB1 bacterium]NIU26539.1 MtnX-like HAD-IB family phosphatase [candidate division KSB1 bacterium]